MCLWDWKKPAQMTFNNDRGWKTHVYWGFPSKKSSLGDQNIKSSKWNIILYTILRVFHNTCHSSRVRGYFVFCDRAWLNANGFKRRCDMTSELNNNKCKHQKRNGNVSAVNFPETSGTYKLLHQYTFYLIGFIPQLSNVTLDWILQQKPEQDHDKKKYI